MDQNNTKTLHFHKIQIFAFSENSDQFITKVRSLNILNQGKRTPYLKQFIWNRVVMNETDQSSGQGDDYELKINHIKDANITNPKVVIIEGGL